MVCACPWAAERSPRSSPWSQYNNGKQMLRAGKELVFSVWFFRPNQEQKSWIIKQAWDTSALSGKGCGWAADPWLSSLAPKSSGHERWPGVGWQIVTRGWSWGDRSRWQPYQIQPSLPYSSLGSKNSCLCHCDANTLRCHLLLAEVNALYIKLPWMKTNCCCALSQKHKAEAVSSQLTINT